VREECNSRVFLEALNARCRREEMGEGGEKKKKPPWWERVFGDLVYMRRSLGAMDSPMGRLSGFDLSPLMRLDFLRIKLHLGDLLTKMENQISPA
jgi:hypothetical protein